MSSFSTSIAATKSGSFRPIVPVLVSDASKLPVSDDPNISSKQSVELKRFLGLVDTGATITCVTKELANELGLRPLGTRLIASASEEVYKNIYRLMISVAAEGAIPAEIESEEIPKTVTLPMSAPSIIEVSEFVKCGKNDVDVLIGMDIIMSSVMIIAGHDRRLTMSF